jgi:DNA-binding MarR family transcriptional regulator
MDRIEDCVSFLMGKAAQQITKRAREKLAPWNVTPVQYAVLKCLWDRDGQSSVEIGGRLVVDSATMTGVLDRLQASGLIERSSDAADRRVQRVNLTRQGAALNEPLDQAMDEMNAEVRAVLGGRSPQVWAGLKLLGKA